MAIGKLYYSHSTSRGSANFKEMPFHDAQIEWKREEASTMSFKSPIKLSEADRIRYKSDTTDFGGQVYNIKKSTNDDYQYEVISYLRLYHDKVTCSFSNMTSSQIMKKVVAMSKNNLSTAGIKTTNIIHSNLKWEKTSIWDIAQQLCWLEHQAGYEVRCQVDANGTLLFNYLDKQQKGYIFDNAFDYNEEYDSSDLITSYSVVYDGKMVASANASSSIIAKWGYVTEIEDCQSSSSNTSSSTSKTTKSTSLRDDVQINKYNIPSKIVNQALSIAKKGNSDYQNLRLIHNWINKNVGYVGYSNSQRGALTTLNKRGGNCCDHANLTIAMARSIGIKCRYAHAKMANGNGHVWGEYFVNGKWFTCDNGTKSTTKYWGSHWSGFGGVRFRYEKLPF